MKKRFLLVIIVLLICLTGCAGKSDIEQSGFLTKADLEGCTMYVHNVTCSEINEMRTVTDLEFLEKIVETSITAEQFRPVTSADVILGGKSDAYYVLDNGKAKYTFSFFEVEKQLDIGFAYREKPIITVAKTVTEETAQDSDEWVWFCTLSAADYAELFETIQRYSDGEIVT